MTDNEVSQALFGAPRDADAGSDYQKLLLEQYKLAVEMADRVSARRGAANTFLLTVNTSLITVWTLVLTKDAPIIQSEAWGSCAALAGLAVCIVWLFQLIAYSRLNRAKYIVVQLLETELPARPFTAEWVAIRQGKNARYRRLAKIERSVPLVFGAIYVVMLLRLAGLF